MSGITRVSGVIQVNGSGSGVLTFSSFGAVSAQVFNIYSVSFMGGFNGGIGNVWINNTLVGQSSNAGEDIAYAVSPTPVSPTEKLTITVNECPPGSVISVQVEGNLVNL